MREMTGYMEHLKQVREKSDEINDAVALDAAVQAMDILDRIRDSGRLRVEIEKELGEDVWPT